MWQVLVQVLGYIKHNKVRGFFTLVVGEDSEQTSRSVLYSIVMSIREKKVQSEEGEIPALGCGCCCFT